MDPTTTAPIPDEGPSSPPAAPSSVFVGRERELEALLGALEEARSVRGRLFLLAGGPGIGKSRLADELATRARERGARVLWGRAWEAGGAPAYWPWVQSIRAYLRGLDPPTLASQVGSGAPELSLMLPEIRDILSDVPDPPDVDPETARFRLFEAVTSFLERAARNGPLVLVLDDIHAADRPSLLLLQFVASELAALRVLIVGAYRDVALGPSHPLVPILAELSREPVTTRLVLGGLAESEIRRFIQAAGAAPSHSVVTAVHRETEGNPLFVGELVRLLLSEGAFGDRTVRDAPRLTLPEGVRDVIALRLGHLSDRCLEVLRHASALGREFSLEALKRLTGRPTTEVLRALDEAAEARVVTDVPGGLGTLRFSHALIRDALYEGLPPTRRYQLHRSIGEILRDLYGTEVESHLAELAHHFFEAAPAGDPKAAVEFARRAGDRAVVTLAYEEAVRLYRMALRALDLEGQGGPVIRCELLMALGDALMRSGEGPDSQADFLAAADLARSLDRPEAFARAALGYGGRFVWTRRGADPHIVPLLEEALEMLGPGDSALRVRLLARLSGALRDDFDRGPRDRLSREALAIARRLGDHSLLALALVARFTAIWAPDTLAEQTVLAEEILTEALHVGDPERILEGRLIRHNMAMTVGEVPRARADLEAAASLAEDLHQPLQRWYVASYRTTLAIQEGRFAEAEAEIERTRELGLRAETMAAEVAYRLQRFVLFRELGRLDAVEAEIDRGVEEFPNYPMFRCVQANLYAHQERTDEARQALEALAREDFAILPFDNEWLFALTFLPEVVHALGDADRAAALYRMLAPYGDQIAISQPEVGVGPVSRYLGLLAATMRRWDHAEAHLQEAMDTSARMGARTWEAHAAAELADVLIVRNGPEDPARAAELAGRSAAIAEELGMAVLLTRAEGLAAATGAEGRLEPTRSAEYEGVFRREGDSWLLAYGTNDLRMRDAKGLRYIHALLSVPGREIHVADLATERSPDARVTGPPEGLEIGGDDAGEVLDPQARSAYARRIEELQQDIDEASGWGDTERATRARQELDFLSRELASAYGLGGRVRRSADRSERIRKAVTNRIRDALGRIERHDPALGRHLANAIATGTFCSYRPDRPIRWRL